MRHVIIGNGIAGTQAAESIRHLDDRCSITMISDEQWPPYSRPMISLVMEGSLKPEGILIREPNFYQRLGIEPVLGSRATSIDTRNRQVIIDQTAIGGARRTLTFDRLLIATGADPRPVKAQGLELENIFFLRNLARQTPWVNAIWPEAVNQGRLAGMNMAGRPVKSQGSLGRNMIRIFELDIMTCGLINPPEKEYEVFNHWDQRRSTYRKLVFRQDRLVGAVMVNDIEQSGLLVSLIQNQRPVDMFKEKLLSPGLNWKQLISAH